MYLHESESSPVVDTGKRALAFIAASTSILSLLCELYGLAPMSAAIVWLFTPGIVLLALLGWLGGRALRADLWAGTWTGLVAAGAYDIFRVPFVLSGLPLFKVFPLFGEMITGLPPTQLSTQLVGWLYHFSNGSTFGVMYVLLAGRRRWPLAIVWALGLELGMLLTPYARFFGITVGVRFVVATVLAHAVFGLTLGLLLRWRAPSEEAHHVDRSPLA